MADTKSWQQLPAIEGDRVLLRWLEERDVPRLFDIFSSHEVTRYWSWPAFDDIAKAKKLLDDIHQSFAQRSLFEWGIVRRDVDLVIGTCTLAHLDMSNGRAELGFALHRDQWGSGFAREAVSTLVDFAFGPLGLRRLEADADPRNERSLHLLEKLGFTREGFLRERWHVNGEVQDAVFFGLLAREWRARPHVSRPSAV
jgi:RimJ/RimL family protein N-acetyltransferase